MRPNPSIRSKPMCAVQMKAKGRNCHFDARMTIAIQIPGAKSV